MKGSLKWLCSISTIRHCERVSHAEPINWDIFLEKEWLLNPGNNPEGKNYGVSKN